MGHLVAARGQKLKYHHAGGGVLTQLPGAGRRHFLRAEFRSNSMVVMGSAAQQIGGIASVR